MTDIVSVEKRSALMAGIKGKNTKPERIIRTALHSRGYRFRLHDKNLSGKPDVVLKKYKTVIFVHGCFWHGHSDCRLFTVPKTRTEFWLTKINGNIERDCRQVAELNGAGWRVLIIWECAIKNKSSEEITFVLDQIEAFISDTAVHYKEIR